MMAVVLSDAQLRNLKAKSREYSVFDSKITGFGVRVSPKGRKAFVFLYRFKGRSRRMTLGKYPGLALADARELAKAYSTEVCKGGDPQGAKSASKANFAHGTYPALVDKYVREYAQKETRSWKETSRVLRRKEISSTWRNVSIEDLSRLDVKQVIDAVGRNGPSAASHAFADLRRFFNWCKSWGYIDKSPCDGFPKFKTRSRKRVLTDEELKRIWHACTDMGDVFGPFVKLLILTLQRRAEVASICVSSVDLAACEWTQKHNKANREHKVFLCPLAVDVIRDRLPFSNDLLFRARGSDRPISGFSKWKRELDALSQVSSWCLHDLRRTATTRMSSLGVPIHVCELILNHRATALDGIAGVYNLHAYEQEQRKAIMAWGQFVESLVTTQAIGTPDNRLGGPENASDIIRGGLAVV